MTTTGTRNFYGGIINTEGNRDAHHVGGGFRLGPFALVGSVLSAVKTLTVTNMHESTIAGDNEMHPTKKETNLASNETNGATTESNLSSDEVNVQNGGIDAAETEAKASTTEATASDAGATASRVKAGASDVETKALKIT